MVVCDGSDSAKTFIKLYFDQSENVKNADELVKFTPDSCTVQRRLNGCQVFFNDRAFVRAKRAHIPDIVLSKYS